MCVPVYVYVHINSWRYTLILNLSILIGRLQLHIYISNGKRLFNCSVSFLFLLHAVDVLLVVDAAHLFSLISLLLGDFFLLILF